MSTQTLWKKILVPTDFSDDSLGQQHREHRPDPGALPLRHEGSVLGRWRGFVLLGLYAAYVAMTLNAGGPSH